MRKSKKESSRCGRGTDPCVKYSPEIPGGKCESYDHCQAAKELDDMVD